ncbi:DUF4238 domain-containing protein [Flavobacterium silvaticum]|uniref:DUF4238 domain-containing protein n=1 Tax=Flavobacterium silvaticum TaxID=1852020 RepID=A0A972JE69_9FLAO|nr:DUF4238 domain-containing protein [Flavobacterium silvaticum]NMH26549.1 DUF4238 domain-containing protein [Flavobacterium silvaticum]
MSTPKNHHFVSQVHIKNFFNEAEGKIYVYDKLKNNFYHKHTTKTLFSELYSNSRFVNGQIDHDSLEQNLNHFFEKDFRQHTEKIQSFIKHKKLNEEIHNSLMYFAKYGIIAELRTPRFKKSMDETLYNGFKEISRNATPKLKTEIEQAFEYRENVTYNNVIDYSEIAEKIFSAMGNLIFKIIIPKNENEYFFIPDFGCANTREKINEYFNPDVKEVAYIGIPLTSKIYITFHSEKLFKNQEIPDSKIVFGSTELVSIYNKVNLDFSESKVACENKEYLENFIKNQSTFA